MSTSALAVSTDTSNWSALTVSPTLTCQRTISASCKPSPRSGSLKYFIAISSASGVSSRASSGVAQHGVTGVKNVLDAGHVQRFQSIQRWRDVRRGDSLDRCLQLQKHPFVETGGDFRADPAGARRLMHDHAATGLAHRGLHRVEVQRFDTGD